jgi:neutral ceramidase
VNVGIRRLDITPAPGLKMAGMLNPPRAQGTRWPLAGTVLLLDDGSRRAAVVALDLLFLAPSTVAELRAALRAGDPRLSPQDITICCSHTHRAPFTSTAMDEDPDFGYLDLVRDRLGTAMAGARAALAPARLAVGRTQARGIAFNRRPVYRIDGGEAVATQGPLDAAEFIRMESPAVEDLAVLFASDPDGRALGGLVCFACHPTAMGFEPVYSADYPGVLTEALADRHGGAWGFLQGAAGDQWGFDLGTPESDGGGIRYGPEHAERTGLRLADAASRAIARARPLADRAAVRTARRILRIPQRRVKREDAEYARDFLEGRLAGVPVAEVQRRLYGHPFTFWPGNWEEEDLARWFAREALGMWEWQRRVGTRELFEDVEVSALAVGEVAIAGFPCELFSAFGARTRASSPFADTLVAELANGWHGYVPTPEAFAHGGYEPRFGYTSRLAPGAGDAMADAAIALLRQLAAG